MLNTLGFKYRRDNLIVEGIILTDASVQGNMRGSWGFALEENDPRVSGKVSGGIWGILKKKSINKLAK